LPSKKPPTEPHRSISPERAIAIFNKLVGSARKLSAERWDSPKRSQWRDTARGALERAGVSDSLMESFDGSQALVLNATNEELRQQMNSNVAAMVAVLQSAVDQLGWQTEDKSVQRRSAQTGLVDSLIIILISAALVIFLLWVTSRTLGVNAFENLPPWLENAYKDIWTPIASGATGIGLAVFKMLTRKKEEPRHNYLVLIGIATVIMLVLIFLLPALFRRRGGYPQTEPIGKPTESQPRVPQPGASEAITYAISGIVTDTLSEPLEGVDIQSIDGRSKARSTTGGRYTIKGEMGSSEKSVRLLYNKAGYAEASETFTGTTTGVATRMEKR
jgi:uncharacterized membrane protein YidH (DUF202 family)